MAATAFSIILSFNDLENVQIYGNNVLKIKCIPVFTTALFKTFYVPINI